jgi:DNA repair exonuclease SbcCD ATPase subunit
LVALTAAAILAACTSQKEPAENAVARVESSLNEIRTDAQQFAAEQLQAVETSVKHLKDNLDKKDYSAVVQGAPSVTSAVAELKTVVEEAKANAAAMQAAAESEWNDLSASVPPMVEKLQARVDQLTKTRKYPQGMDKAAFEAAKSGFETLKTEWTDATAEFTSGHAPDAVRKARSAKAKAQELINTLEVQV